MKKISMALAIAGLGAAAMMTACTDSGTQAKKPTKAQECAAGLSTECLIGDWSAKGVANVTTGEMHPSFNYSSAPGTLSFMDNGQFMYDVPAGAPAAANCGQKTYGTWSVSGNTLTMKSTVGGLCLPTKSYSGTPKVTVGAGTVDLVFEKLFFLFNVSDEAGDRAGYGDVFSISAQ